MVDFLKLRTIMAAILAAILDFGRHIDFHVGVAITNYMFGYDLQICQMFCV